MTPKNRRGRKPLSSRGKLKTNEEAVIQILSDEFWKLVDMLQPMKWGKDESELKNIIDGGHSREAAFFVGGFFFCKYWMVKEVFPEFIQSHAKNIDAAPYARLAAQPLQQLKSMLRNAPNETVEKALLKSGLTKRDFRKLFDTPFPSKTMRDTWHKLLPSDITKKDIEGVLKEEYDGKDFEHIALKSKLKVSEVEQIIEAAKKRRMHVSTPSLRDGRKVLVLNFDKPRRKYGREKRKDSNMN